MIERCRWCGTDPLYVAYHDTEWGVPCRDARALFELLMLEGFQAGLSWITILKKRDNFRAAFDGFDPVSLAGWGRQEVATALQDAGIVRHRAKIEATIRGAQSWCRIEAAGGFAPFVWDRVQGTPIQNAFTNSGEVPASTPLSIQLSRDLKAEGFGFCGPTIAYAFCQAGGLVNDHLIACHRHAQVAALA